MKKVKIFALFIVLSVGTLLAKNSQPIVYKINIKEDIGGKTWVYLQNGLHEASQKNADCVLIHMNTYGGGVLEADSMRTAILNFSRPVYVFVDNNAASAGALIAIACDSIYMRSGASIGAATVVNMADGVAAPDKYQSYMRSMIRATAESHGGDTIVENGERAIKWRRNPKIAEAMVDERVVIPGLVDSTQVLTLTANQAMELGYCEGVAGSVHEVVSSYLGYSDYELVSYNPSFYDKIKGFLMSGVVQAVLIMLIIGGIYLELQSPGVGFPTAVAISAAILYFTPLYLTGYAENWEVLLFVLGLIFIVFEVFVFPGFGVSGILGIFFVLAGLVLAMVGNIQFDFSGLPYSEYFRAIMIVLAGLGLSAGLIIYFSSRIGKPGLFRKVALLSDQEGYVSVPMEPVSLVGKTGVAATVLRPSGRVEVDGELYDAVSLKGFIEKGDEVIVRGYKNFQLHVTKK